MTITQIHPIFLVAAAAFIGAAGFLIHGLRHWKEPRGKRIAIAAGLLLLLLLLAAVVVLIAVVLTVQSGSMGLAPAAPAPLA